MSRRSKHNRKQRQATEQARMLSNGVLKGNKARKAVQQLRALLSYGFVTIDRMNLVPDDEGNFHIEYIGSYRKKPIDPDVPTDINFAQSGFEINTDVFLKFGKPPLPGKQPGEWAICMDAVPGSKPMIIERKGNHVQVVKVFGTEQGGRTSTKIRNGQEQYGLRIPFFRRKEG